MSITVEGIKLSLRAARILTCDVKQLQYSKQPRESVHGNNRNNTFFHKIALQQMLPILSNNNNNNNTFLTRSMLPYWLNRSVRSPSVTLSVSLVM